MRRQIVLGVRMLLVLTLLIGLAYPLLVTAIAQLTMPGRANGSLVSVDGTVVGSALLGQSFDGGKWFQSRPGSYDPAASGPSNLGPTNPDLIATVRRRLADLRAEDHVSDGVSVPADAVTGSASGLDPDISPAYARLQAPRIAAVRGLAVSDVLALIRRQISGRTFEFLGDPRVNVLLLNLALERLA